MAKAVHVGNQTEHGVPLTGSGSPNVFINGKPAWRAIPAGVGDGLEEASKAIKQIMDKPLFAPPDVAPELPKIQAKMMESAAKAAQAKNPGAVPGVTTAFVTLTTTTVGLTAAYTAGAAVPGGEPAARTAFTMGFKTALSSAASAAVTALGGTWDMHTCSLATPMPHGPGLFTRGEPTVSINGFDAAIDEASLFEATGGKVGITVASQNVFIGKGVSFGGGGGASAGGGAKPAIAKSGTNSPAKQTSASPKRSSSEGDDAVGKEDPVETFFDLWIRLPIPSDQASQCEDIFRLVSTDSSVNETRTVADDMIPNNDTIDLLFTHQVLEKSYSLYVVRQGVESSVFEDLAGQALHQVHSNGVPEASSSSTEVDDEGDSDCDPWLGEEEPV